MSANDLIEVRGTVRLEALGGASKQAHKGFVLEHAGGRYTLRTNTGNPFYDPFFQPYEGKLVRVRGYDLDGFLFVESIDPV